MFAPNPHWWKEPAEEYRYSGVGYPKLVTWSICLVCLLATTLPPPFFGVTIGFGFFVFYTGHILGTTKGSHGGTHFQIRYNFLTIWHGDSMGLHEDMREIVSLEPVLDRKAKLSYHQLLFANGKSARIYSKLERHDELIVKLQGYLDERLHTA